MNNGMNISNLHNANAGKGSVAGATGKLKGVARLAAADDVPSPLSGDVMNAALSSDSDSGVSSFQKVYMEIAKCNKIAQSNNGAKNGTDSDTAGPDAAIQALLDSGVLNQLNGSTGFQNSDLAQILGAAADSSSSTSLSTDAAALIRDAITTITKMLNLKVQDGLENLSSITPTQAIVNQFAEMLSTLKGITGVLDESVKLNQPLEYKTLAFGVESAASTQQVIHEQMFKIELALKMMGISGDVAASMAQKDNVVQDAVAALSGIPQASDPSKLSMPAIHVNQLLGEAMASKEQKVETLLTKLANSLKASNGPDATALLTKIAGTATATTTIASTASASTKQTATDIKEMSLLDSQVMRKILKVDATHATESENKNAAQQNVALDLPKDGKAMTSETLADMVQHAKTPDTSTVFQGQDVGTSSDVNKLFSLPRANETGTPRQLEESVIQQVADKLSVAAKTGVTEIRVLLRPESLGEVQLKIKVDGDVVMGKMYVENQQVKHIVEANLQTLKDSLSQHHLSVGSFSVDINHGGNAHEQMRDMANMGTKDGNGNGSNTKEGRDEMENGEGLAKTPISGIETGRKFGTNTIEYFA